MKALFLARLAKLCAGATCCVSEDRAATEILDGSEPSEGEHLADTVFGNMAEPIDSPGTEWASRLIVTWLGELDYDDDTK